MLLWSNRKCQPLPLLFYFRGCVSEVIALSYQVICFTRMTWNMSFVFNCYYEFYHVCKYKDTYDPMVIFACWLITPSDHYHYAELMAWNMTWFLGYSIDAVFKFKSILLIMFMHYMRLSVIGVSIFLSVRRQEGLKSRKMSQTCTLNSLWCHCAM